MRVYRMLDAVGSALILQLLFAATAVPIITAVPAAVALQDQWRAFREGRKTTAGTFLRAFVTALRMRWIAGLIGPVILAATLVAYVFWSSATGWPAVVAMGLLIGLTLVAIGYWLALLAASLQGPHTTGDWLRAGLQELLVNAPRYVLAIAAMLVWFGALWFVAPLALVGAGIVPAALAHWAARYPAPAPSRQASRS